MSIEPEVHDPLFRDPLEQYNYIAGQINALNLMYEQLGSPTRFVPTALVDNPVLKTTPNNNPFIEAMSQGLDKGKQPEGSGSGPPDDNPTSTTPRPKAPIANKKFKAKVLDDYTGDVEKAKTFLRQLKLYFESRDTEFSTQRKKVIFALSYMRGGTAGPWADHIIDKISDDDDMDCSFMFSIFTSFTRLFIERFGERDENAAAHHKMTQLKQGSMTVDELIAKFEELEYLTDYNDVAHIQEFKRICNPKIIDLLVNKIPAPDILK